MTTLQEINCMHQLKHDKALNVITFALLMNLFIIVFLMKLEHHRYVPMHDASTQRGGSHSFPCDVQCAPTRLTFATN